MFPNDTGHLDKVFVYPQRPCTFHADRHQLGVFRSASADYCPRSDHQCR
jgi:hypothetical protein